MQNYEPTLSGVLLRVVHPVDHTTIHHTAFVHLLRHRYDQLERCVASLLGRFFRPENGFRDKRRDDVQTGGWNDGKQATI